MTRISDQMPVAVGDLRGAVRKASKRRLRADFCRAAWLVQDAQDLCQTLPEVRAYVRGAIAVEPSLTVQAALLTAWGD